MIVSTEKSGHFKGLDYYAFGMQMPGRTFNSPSYRYGMNGQEKDDEITGVSGATYTATHWEYDARLGRRWNTDPVVKDKESPYACFNDNPILKTDKEGDDAVTAGAIFVVTQELAAAAASTGVGLPVAAAIEVVGSIWGLVELLEDVPVNKPTIVLKKESSTTVKAKAATPTEQKVKERAEKLNKKDRSGKDFTKAGKENVKDANKVKNQGQTKCENCGTQTVPGKQSKSGETPPGNETHVDHVDPKSNGGSGTPNNGQVLCRDCNLDKGANAPHK
jgi:RHS repeat-associated protein